MTTTSSSTSHLLALALPSVLLNLAGGSFRFAFFSGYAAPCSGVQVISQIEYCTEHGAAFIFLWKKESCDSKSAIINFFQKCWSHTISASKGTLSVIWFFGEVLLIYLLMCSFEMSYLRSRSTWLGSPNQCLLNSHRVIKEHFLPKLCKFFNILLDVWIICKLRFLHAFYLGIHRLLF
jgi:hypothetical protein